VRESSVDGSGGRPKAGRSRRIDSLAACLVMLGVAGFLVSDHGDARAGDGEVPWLALAMWSVGSTRAVDGDAGIHEMSVART
jgi:hypothetical protein